MANSDDGDVFFNSGDPFGSEPPGAIVEQRRTIWALSATKVLDGGPDGDADTASGNQVFQTAGIFVP